MNTLVTLLLVIASCYQILGDQVRYDGFKVYRLTPRSKEAVAALKNLHDSNAYDFWTDVRGVGHPVDIMVPPHFKYRFNDTITSGEFDAEVFISDVQKLIDDEKPKGKVPADLEWTNYHDLDEINEWLEAQVTEHPGIVTRLHVGTSYEGRDILGIKISFAPGNEGRSIFIEANIHAREWITSAVATWIANEVLTTDDPAVREHDWYFVPVFNPDGFQYTKDADRLWRKTRVPHFLCVGTDPNRNWAYHFNEGGTSVFPCSDVYNGPEAFSEPSTKSISDFISTIGENLEAYISFHSYGQLILIPYGYTSEHLDNFAELEEIGLLAATSLATRYETEYTVGNIVEALYVASGGSMDWVKGEFGTRFTYTYELRDTGEKGFILPPEQIIPTAQETWDSLLTMLEEFDKKITSPS